jgi:hypothetical protein
MAIISLTQIVCINTSNTNGFGSNDIWILTLYLLSVKISQNVLEIKYKRIRHSSFPEITLSHEVLMLIHTLVIQHRRSVDHGKVEFDLVKYMRFHVKDCKNIHCNCHDLEEIYDFGQNKVYDREYKFKIKDEDELDSGNTHMRKQVIREYDVNQYDTQ